MKAILWETQNNNGKDTKFLYDCFQKHLTLKKSEMQNVIQIIDETGHESKLYL